VPFAIFKPKNRKTGVPTARGKMAVPKCLVQWLMTGFLKAVFSSRSPIILFYVCLPEGGLGFSWLKHAPKQSPPTTLASGCGQGRGFILFFCLRVVPDAITAASGSSLLFDQYRPFAILKPKNRKTEKPVAYCC
jgi:hypothetical protein